MDFLKTISTAHSTYTEGAPLVTTLKLTAGRLVGGWIYFPSGPAGVLHAVVRRGFSQILPANQGDDYALNDIVVPLHLDLDLTWAPFSLDVLTWNTSTTYAHTCTVCCFLDPLAEPKYERTWWDKIRGKLAA